MTPLLMAASTCQSNLVKALVVNRADAGAKTFDGKTILDLTWANARPLCTWLQANGRTKDGAALGWQTTAEKREAREQASSKEKRKTDMATSVSRSIRHCMAAEWQLTKKRARPHNFSQASSQQQNERKRQRKGGKCTSWGGYGGKSSSSWGKRSWCENSSWGQGSGWWGN